MKKIVMTSPLFTLIIVINSSLSTFAAVPGLDTLVGFDTAWTLVYDGGVDKRNKAVIDHINSATSISDGSIICTGVSRDTSLLLDQLLLIKIDKTGNIIWKRLYSGENHYYGYSVIVARNSDLIIGGGSWGAPLIMRTDSIGNLKWSKWYYDTLKDEDYLHGTRVTVNSLHETKRGTIICAAGDDYNGNIAQNNYAAFLELDSTGKVLRTNEWDNEAGYKIQGFCIDEASGGGYMLSGYRAVFFLDTTGSEHWQRSYSYMLDGVGSEVADFVRAKFLRGNRPMIMGRTYEGNCWTLYQKLYYNVWWSQLDNDLTSMTRDTAGRGRGDDVAYDFAQLENGNIVFIGEKYNTSSDSGGIWVIVTDSTGRKTFWERQFRLPYKSSDGRNILPLSVCATPDSGFTVVGRYTFTEAEGSYNGFATHFAPKDPRIVSSLKTVPKTIRTPTITMVGSKLIISVDQPMNCSEINFCDVAGRKITNTQEFRVNKTGNILEWDFSKVAKGIYFYSVKTRSTTYAGSITAGMK